MGRRLPPLSILSVLPFCEVKGSPCLAESHQSFHSSLLKDRQQGLGLVSKPLSIPGPGSIPVNAHRPVVFLPRQLWQWEWCPLIRLP